MKLLILVFALTFGGCASVSQYGHGCRDGVGDLSGQLGTLGVVLKEGDALDRYCDAVERQHTKTPKERR